MLPPLPALALLALLALLAVAALALLCRSPWPRAPAAPLRTMVVLGSGGHTAEMFALLGAMDMARYAPRCYVVAATDSGSAAKAHAFEAALASPPASPRSPRARRGAKAAPAPAAPSYTVLTIPRSREVGQSYISSVWTSLVALAAAAKLLWAAAPRVLLCNGPGTCLPLAVAALAARLHPRRPPCAVVYVESVARVRKLSLTGALLYRLRLADAFFVQWPALEAAHPRARCLGRLM